MSTQGRGDRALAPRKPADTAAGRPFGNRSARARAGFLALIPADSTQGPESRGLFGLAAAADHRGAWQHPVLRGVASSMRGFVVLWGLVGLLLLYGGVARRACAQAAAAATSGERFGRSVTLGGASFAPWGPAPDADHLRSLARRVASLASPQFSVARLEIDADARSLLHLALVVESLKITSPRLRVARTGEGR